MPKEEEDQSFRVTDKRLFTEDGKLRGRYVASGFVPRFYDDLQRRGIPVNMGIFREE